MFLPKLNNNLIEVCEVTTHIGNITNLWVAGKRPSIRVKNEDVIAEFIRQSIYGKNSVDKVEVVKM